MVKRFAFARFGSAAWSSLEVALGLVLCTLGLSLAANAQRGTIITFDVPGANTGAGQGTIGFGIIPNGAILGYYLDGNDVYHGFLRARDSKITTFDAPGAGSGAFQGTLAPWHQPAGSHYGILH
jgi:hypothetical protein